MGLTYNSVGLKAVDSGLIIRKQNESDKVVALAGNPNVGKSTVFNALTGMNQHTGNWPGKTVANAQGYCRTEQHSYVMVDIPGTYSLMAHSTEEEVARNYICFGNADVVVVVCDATCLERNLNLVLQTLEISGNVVVCLNLMDEAKRKRICIDVEQLGKKLGVPVVAATARKKKSLAPLMAALDNYDYNLDEKRPIKITYPEMVEDAIEKVETVLRKKDCGNLNTRWLAIRLLDTDESLKKEIAAHLSADFLQDEELTKSIEESLQNLSEFGIETQQLKDLIVTSVVHAAECISMDTVRYDCDSYADTDRRIDRILTSKWAGFPLMIVLLAFVFWLTITGANYPSELLSDGLFFVQDKLTQLFHYIGVPEWLHGALVLGVYRVLAWVVSVMLPPMAIFFPLFTLLEDAGFLPRIAYNLDKPFKRCRACGKQALTMCMGFGCNAAGVVGCRIIDSPRERLLAIITNNFVPCNGRFPTLIAILTMFFVGTSGGAFASALSAALLTVVIVFGVLMTFFVTKMLSVTVLKGTASSFTLELPPYRIPQIGKVIVRSIFERTLFVLGRAVAVAAPAGLIIWLMANLQIGGVSLLNCCADFLDPFARLMGIDGIILIAFILGFPANEIVVPIVIMAYMAQGSILDFENLSQMKELFVQHGWTWITAVSVMLFSLMHWPCSTTMITIKKETGSWKWTLISAAVPTVIGIAVCILFTSIAKLII